MNIEETIKEILEQGKDRITSDERKLVLETLHGFLSSHPDYVPHIAREKKSSSEENELWSSIQPILDRAQGMDRYTHPTLR